MPRRLYIPALVSWLVIAVASGCPAGSNQAQNAQSAHAGLLAACDADSDCSSQLCTFGLYSLNEAGVCSKTCKSNADCTSDMGKHASCRNVAVIPDLGASKSSPTWRKACVLPCKDSEPGVFECQDGVRAFCDADAPPSCKVCGCDPNSYCDSKSDQCKAYAHEGEKCAADAECLSGKCAHALCTSGPGDACDDSCDGTCGGPSDALYCMPACTDGQCPVRMHGWECIGDAKQQQYCGHVCKDVSDCLNDSDVCEPFPDYKPGMPWPYYFTGFCHQPRGK